MTFINHPKARKKSYALVSHTKSISSVSFESKSRKHFFVESKAYITDVCSVLTKSCVKLFLCEIYHSLTKGQRKCVFLPGNEIGGN